MGHQHSSGPSREHRSQAVTRACLICALALGMVAPRVARAFSDPAAFADEPEKGGGGGRFFTGSPHDGYTCGVCHRGGNSPDLLILGLPVAGYRLGTSYEVTIEWPNDMQRNVALEAELTDRSGVRAGTLRLPPQDELLPSELCLPVGAGVGAGMLNEAGTRTVVSLPDCGAQRLRLLWTAPAQDVGPVWLTGSLVSSNAQGDVKGDGVTDFARVLPSHAAPDPIATRISAGGIGAGCSTTRPARTDTWMPTIAVVFLIWKRRRLGLSRLSPLYSRA